MRDKSPLCKGTDMSRVIVVGGGAAGMMAAYRAAMNGHETVLLEKNEKLGKKLYITGKGRCNVTNASDMDTVMSQIVSNPRFLYSAFADCSNIDVMELIEKGGCPLKTERGQRVFPESDKSSDIISCFAYLLKKAGVQVCLKTEVKRILTAGGAVRGVELSGESKERLEADAVILATGGLSYQSTGSTGDGHRMAKELGHTVTQCYPALVPFNTKEDWPRRLQGLSLKNITFTVLDGKRKLFEEFGEMLFTHFGVSGPLVLSASSRIVKRLAKNPLQAQIDLKPALTPEQLDGRLLRDFSQEKNRRFKNALYGLLPSRLADEIVLLSGIDPEKAVNAVTREERSALVRLVKNLPLTIDSARGYNEAIITQGGVKVQEVSAGTMESRLVKGLYFAGELLDIDAMTGGYNLQLAWSTGSLAGNSIEWV